jgi:hypothetical protein
MRGTRSRLLKSTVQDEIANLFIVCAMAKVYTPHTRRLGAQMTIGPRVVVFRMSLTQLPSLAVADSRRGIDLSVAVTIQRLIIAMGGQGPKATVSFQIYCTRVKLSCEMAKGVSLCFRNTCCRKTKASGIAVASRVITCWIIQAGLLISSGQRVGRSAEATASCSLLSVEA